MPASTPTNYDRPTFDALRRDLAGPVFGYVMRLVDEPELAEDLTQDIFVAVYRHLAQLRSRDSARSWVFGIAINRVRTHFRRHAILQWVPLDREAETVCTDDGVDTALAVRSALAMLAPADREVLVLIGQMGFTAVETAEMLNVSPDAVQKRWQRAKVRFAGAIEGVGL